MLIALRPKSLPSSPDLSQCLENDELVWYFLIWFCLSSWSDSFERPVFFLDSGTTNGSREPQWVSSFSILFVPKTYSINRLYSASSVGDFWLLLKVSLKLSGISARQYSKLHVSKLAEYSKAVLHFRILWAIDFFSWVFIFALGASWC